VRGDDVYDATVAARFWAKVDRRGDDDCWPWRAQVTGDGYGGFYTGRTIGAHRVAYELVRGPIPEGLVIDHLCRNRLCVNPYHMEPVTNAENVRRGISGYVNGFRTHCHNGHPYDAGSWVRRGGRECKICKAARMRRYYAKREARHPG
jgi:hypothetical protein